MGLWITGYSEFAYDRPGSDYSWTDKYPPKLGPVPFPCPICGKTFASLDEVMQHRFETHPLKRPILFLRGKEAPSTRSVIFSPLAPGDVHCSDAVSVALNGQPVRPDELSAKLAAQQSGLKEIVLLSSGAVTTRYELLFEIADDEDIAAVDGAFFRLIRPDELSVDRVELLVRETRGYRSANRYVDGLAQYLYGVMAKGRWGGTHIPFEQYRERFNLSTTALTGFATPLAEAVAGVIALSLNVFEGHGLLRHSPRLALSLKWFRDVIAQGGAEELFSFEENGRGVVEIPLDAATESLMRWTEEMILAGHLGEENHVRKCADDATWAGDDRFKATVLLAEHYRGAGCLKEARNLARPYSEDAFFGRWAASFPTEGEGRKP